MTAACVDCGRELPAVQLDMTGKGWRCNACTVAASIKKLEGGSTLVEHLDAGELARVAKRGRVEIATGILGALGGVVLTAIRFGAGITGKPLGVGAAVTVGGIAGIAHGRWLVRDAERGLRQLEGG